MGYAVQSAQANLVQSERSFDNRLWSEAGLPSPFARREEPLWGGFRAAGKIPIVGFYQASPKLARGAIPTKEGIRWLAQHGFKTIVDLRVITSEREKRQANSLGMNYVNIPVTLLYPSRKVMSDFFSVLDDPRAAPVYVHCFFGTDRAGMMVALYRELKQNWTADQALAELRSHHFRPWLWQYADVVRNGRKYANVPIDRHYLDIVQAQG